MIEVNKVYANVAMKFLTTLRRLDLADKPGGAYRDAKRVFNIWQYAKKYGDFADDKSQE